MRENNDVDKLMKEAYMKEKETKVIYSFQDL